MFSAICCYHAGEKHCTSFPLRSPSVNVTKSAGNGGSLIENFIFCAEKPVILLKPFNFCKMFNELYLET